ncbi:TetR/AcrR family transcriptional regulator, partial [Streptomyces sp. TRM76130]|nr:TetR/AcrR family transcriptional regulator [Streptomyces sp. TRM76130]
ESALWMVEAILAGAGDRGCTPEQAVEVFRGIWYYTVGEILVRAHSGRRQAGDGRALTREPSFSGLNASQVPCLAAIGSRWTALAARDTYRRGLGVFVDGLLAQASVPHPARGAANPHH